MFLRGLASDGEPISGFFKLQKIRTGKNIVLGFPFYLFKYFLIAKKLETIPKRTPDNKIITEI